MIVIVAAMAGAVLGVRAAARAGGTRADKVQYGAAFAIAFALLGTFATIAIDRLL